MYINSDNRYEVLRAEHEWERAGAYSVRVQGMNRQYHISLREEFDEHDTDGTRYIVILDDGYPVATCRFYENDKETVTLGRVVVLPEYRGQHLGERVIHEAEKWIAECGYKEIEIDSRLEVTGFYEKLGYDHICDTVIKSGDFDCVKMKKNINGKIKVVIFDMFETLVTLTGNHYLSRHMAIDAGVPVDDFRKVWWESEYDRSSGKRTSEECIADTLKRVGRYSDELCGMIIEKRIDTKKKVFEEESLHPAVIPMLKALKDKGLKIAVISNCYNEEAAAIRNSCLFPYIDMLYLSCEQGVCKPEKLIFDRCLAGLELAPGECLYVGDGGSRELEMAGEVGMHPVQAAWYFKEDSEQPCTRLPGFIQAEDPMEITKLTDNGTDIHYVPLYVREKKTISVVFTDLDGTLLRNDKTISAGTMDVLRQCKEKGISIVVCSARPERAITMYEELGIADALITLNGARIRIGSKVINNGIDHETGAELLKDLLDDEELIVTVETSDGIYGNVSIPEWGVTGRSDLMDLLMARDLYKILVSAKDKGNTADDRVCAVIAAHGADDKVYYSVSEGWLYQIMGRAATKYNGAKLVLESLGIDEDSAVYFGDDNDDCESISKMGLGVAVSNAIERVLKAADAFAPSNEEDGVAVVLKRLLK